MPLGGTVDVAVTGFVGGGGVPMSMAQVSRVYCWMRVAAGVLASAASVAAASDSGSPGVTVAAVSRLAVNVDHSGSIAAGATAAISR